MSGQDGFTPDGGQNLHSRVGFFNEGGADENSDDGFTAQFRDSESCFKAFPLSAEGVAGGGDIHQTQPGLVTAGNVFGEENQSGAGAENRHAGSSAGFDGLHQLPVVQQLANGGAFAAGDDQPVDSGQVIRFSDFNSFYAAALHHEPMFPKSALEGEYADFHYQPRSCILS